MKKTAIIYASKHHGNTFKLVEAISQKYNVTLIDATLQQTFNLQEYDLIGFASGIDFGKFYKEIKKFLNDNLPDNKKVFFIYTCAKKSSTFTRSIGEKANAKHSELLGEYGCRGYNTYGPWKLFGGMNKGHPTASETEDAIRFYENLLKNQEA